MTYFIGYIPTSIPSSWLLGKSLYVSTLISNITLALGAWIRYVAFDVYGVALLGQYIIASSNALVIAAPAGLSAEWFAPSERGLSTALASLMNFIGMAMGYILPPVIGLRNGLLM